jgi:hypothetical protein
MVDEEIQIALLRDSSGPYGIGVSLNGVWTRPLIILRPDCIYPQDVTDDKVAALQRITLASLFRNTLEFDLVRQAHRKFLARHGIAHSSLNDWYPTILPDKVERRLFFGSLRSALSIVNRLVRELLDKAVPLPLLRLARRFPFQDRLPIYRNIVLSRRTAQLCETFPALASGLYGTCRTQAGGPDQERIDQARNMVEEGARLRDVAAHVGLPWCMRKMKPGVAHLALNLTRLFREDPALVNAHLPGTQHEMRIWLFALDRAFQIPADPRFRSWVARNALQLGRTCEVVRNQVSDLGDWAVASAAQGGNRIVQEMLRRPFSPGMAVATAIEQSRAWHEDVARYRGEIENNGADFPEPWLEGMKIEGYQVVPLRNQPELMHEGRAMGHCVGSYTDRVVLGNCHIYSVRSDDRPIATLELVRQDGGFRAGQLRGPRNANVAPAIRKVVAKWLRAAPRPNPVDECAAVR